MTRRGPCCLPALIFLALSVNVDGFQVPVRAVALGRRHAVQLSAGVLATTRKWSKTAALMAGPPARGRAGVKTVMQLSDVETSPMALPEGLYKMNADMRVAVQMEDFKKAAELRDSIKAETAREPVARLLAQLKEAVDEQDYAAAKTLKQQLAGAVKDRALEMRSARGRSPYKVNRLLILNGDGSLLTTDPGGSCPVVLSNPDEAGKIGFMQPCWSPGGDLVVATKVELANKQLAKSKESTVQVFWALDGSELIDVAAPFVPFFYFWMPDSKVMDPACFARSHAFTSNTHLLRLLIHPYNTYNICHLTGAGVPHHLRRRQARGGLAGLHGHGACDDGGSVRAAGGWLHDACRGRCADACGEWSLAYVCASARICVSVCLSLFVCAHTARTCLCTCVTPLWVRPRTRALAPRACGLAGGRTGVHVDVRDEFCAPAEG